MRDSIKDVLIFGTLTTFSCYFVTWLIFFPYFGSLMKLKNENITMDQLIFAYFFMFIGMIVGAQFFAMMMPKYGVKRMVLIVAFLQSGLYIYTMFIQYFFMIIILGLLIGCGHILTILSFQTYMKIKYPQFYGVYFGFVTMGYSISSFIQIAMIQLIINPENEPMDYVEFGEPIFSPNVSKNVSTYLIVQAISSFIIIVFLQSFLNWEIGVDIPEVEEKVRVSNTLQEPLLTSESDPATVSTFSYRRLLLAPQFAMIIFPAITRWTSDEYYAINVVYIGNLYFKNASATMFVFFVSTIPNFLARTITGYSFKKMGLFNSFVLFYVLGVFSDFIFVNYATTSFSVYVFLTLFHRFTLPFNWQYCTLSLFETYDLKTAVRLSPFFESHHVLRSLTMNGVSYFFKGNQDFVNVFRMFFYFDLVCLCIFIYLHRRAQLAK